MRAFFLRVSGASRFPRRFAFPAIILCLIVYVLAIGDSHFLAIPGDSHVLVIPHQARGLIKSRILVAFGVWCPRPAPSNSLIVISFPRLLSLFVIFVLGGGYMHSRLARTIVTNLGFSASFDSLRVRIIHILVHTTNQNKATKKSAP